MDVQYLIQIAMVVLLIPLEKKMQIINVFVSHITLKMELIRLLVEIAIIAVINVKFYQVIVLNVQLILTEL
jgi:hypothetical protein